MRTVLHILFLFFYIGSSYATTQHRLAYVVHKLRHSADRGDDSAFENACKERVGYTHFREAKKVSSDFVLRTESELRAEPPVSKRRFLVRPTSAPSQFDADTSHSRAPPHI